MNKLLLTLCFIVSVLFSKAQTGTYRSVDNPYYWKNKKPYEGYWQQDVHYTINATLVDTANRVDGNLTLIYYNNSPDTLTEVYFHLYQNAFIKGSYLESLNKANKFYQKFGKYEAAGKGTEIVSLQASLLAPLPEATPETNGRPNIDPLITKIEAEVSIDFSIMRVKLKEPIMPGNKAQFIISFITYFDDGGDQRRRMKLFDAYGNKHFDGVHWYPRICVYDRKFGWETDQHLGKEFYGDFGTFEVNLNFPTHYVLDATGLLLNKEEVLPAELRSKLDISNFKNKPLYEKPSVIIANNGSYKTWKFRAINVHDFAWTADPTYRIGEVIAELPGGEKVSCIALAQEPHASRWQDAAAFTANVIKLYSRDFGTYAYPKMIVADARDGMEYPMLTLDGGLSPNYYGLFAHEIGHNWFFGMVGNNETYRASLDEGFTQFLTHWSMSRLTSETPYRTNKGYNKFYEPLPLMDQTVYLGYIRDAINKTDMPLNTHSDDFNGALHHGGGYGHVYYKTATMLYNLQYVLGETLFSNAMKHYFNQWKMCHPYFEDFRNSIIQYTHVDLNWFFDQWLETTKTIDYAIVGKAKQLQNEDGSKSDFYKIKLKRKGDMQMPVDLMAYSNDGKIYTYTISNTYFFKSSPEFQKLNTKQTWRGWGKLNTTYWATVYCPNGLNKISIDTTYRLADVNQLNNSTKTPVHFTFDHQLKNPLNRRKYILKWRPELWYNGIDGLKTGIHFNGNYMNYKHIFRSTVWYNTGFLSNIENEVNTPINYALSYTNNFPRDFSYQIESRFLDGLWFQKIGVSKTYGKNIFSVFLKSLYRNKLSDLAYVTLDGQWQSDMFNNTLNLQLSRNYSYKKGYGNILIGLRSSTVLSDYNYASAFITVVNENKLGKFDFRTRFFAQYMDGANIAPESRLNVAGANNEQLSDNKFVRSRGFIPTGWLGYGNNVNHFQMGGGLNVRGYAGYLLPENVNNTQVNLNTGESGVAFNGELDIDRLIKWQPNRLKNYFHIDLYIFGDAGIIQRSFKAGEFGLTQQTKVWSTPLISAGTGALFTIKKWGRLDEPKPLGIRFDMPLFINNTPFVDGEYLAFRWMIGINRSF
ncbi:MAG: M1 family metallopeptidase [Bacteroidia bacterium]|jgi:aminopeptidase N|nr:M1 family metallopeptidase [Bacteroidia bacterium]